MVYNIDVDGRCWMVLMVDDGWCIILMLMLLLIGDDG